MPAELVMLYNDTPRFGFATALIHDTDTKAFTTVIANESKATTMIIQPLEDTLISFGQSRRSTIQDLEFISQSERKHKDFNKLSNGDIFTAPPVTRTQPTISVKDGNMVLWVNDIDTGWVRYTDVAHFSSHEILKAEKLIEGNRTRPMAYLVEMQPFTLMTLELGFHQFYYYYSTVWPTKEFFVGNALYVRTAGGKFALEGGYDPDPNICRTVKNIKMQEYLKNRGVL